MDLMENVQIRNVFVYILFKYPHCVNCVLEQIKLCKVIIYMIREESHAKKKVTVDSRDVHIISSIT
jgi:predicted transport protein